MFGFVRLFLVFYTSSLCDSCRLAGGLFFRFFPVPASGNPDGDAVDFDITVQLDNETLSAVDQLRVDEIRALRNDLNDHIRCLDLETAGIIDIAHHESRVLSGSLVKTLIEDVHAVVRYTATGEDRFHLIFIQHDRFGIFLMLLGNLAHFFMNVLYYFNGTGIA